MRPDWKGVYSAVTTAFLPSGEIDAEGFQRQITAQTAAGVNGIIVGGSLGESSTLSHDDRLVLLELAKGMAGEVPVLVNIAEGSTQAAVRLATHAADRGADGLMVLPPMMYRPTEAETIRHFTSITESTEIPVMIYNNPVDYKVEVTIPMLEGLLKLDGIQSIKESTRDISNVLRMRTAFGDRLRILCGVDTLALEELMMGADGWVAGLVNAFPSETVAIFRLCREGRFDEAKRIYAWFLPLLELDIDPQLVQNIKLAQALTGQGTEHVRLPRQPLSGSQRDRVMSVVKKGLETRPVLPDL